MSHRYNTRFQVMRQKSQPPTPQPSPQLAPQPSPHTISSFVSEFYLESTNAAKIVKEILNKVDPNDTIIMIESSIELFSYLIYHPGLLERSITFRTTLINKLVDYRDSIQRDRNKFELQKVEIQSNPSELDSLLTLSKKVSLMDHLEKMMNRLDVVLNDIQKKTL